MEKNEITVNEPPSPQSSILVPQSSKKPTLVVTTRPNDANPDGDIFGGWLLSQIDIAGQIVATKRAKGSVATVAVKDMLFLQPLFVQDVVSFYCELAKVGKTSIAVSVKVYSDRKLGEGEKNVHVADATFIYVAIEKPGVKREVPAESLG